MKLSWSHAVMYVRDQEEMLKFYTQVLGFEITDRGLMGEGAPELVFMSQDPKEHHQIAMIQSRKDNNRSNSVNHFAFRVDSFEEVSQLNRQLEKIEGLKIMPLSHGNTLSIYFSDPEGNGIEVFWDTPWHVAQPQGKAWDPSLNEAEALAWVKSNFQDEASFVPREEYYDHQHLRS
ncbi:MAG: glyoxalase [Gammaproteobacteria bacterium]|nr:glyoxalase [Gammaproteobacteria bacterium]